MVTKILDHLYLGDIHDARKFEGTIICVMQDLVEALEPEKAYWIPVIRTSGGEIDYDKLIAENDVVVRALPHQIDVVVDMIHDYRRCYQDVLIHCMAGIERSPLVIACYLHDWEGYTWDEAYDFIKEKRPEVANRLPWLNLSYDERQS